MTAVAQPRHSNAKFQLGGFGILGAAKRTTEEHGNEGEEQWVLTDNLHLSHKLSWGFMMVHDRSSKLSITIINPLLMVKLGVSQLGSAIHDRKESPRRTSDVPVAMTSSPPGRHAPAGAAVDFYHSTQHQPSLSVTT